MAKDSPKEIESVDPFDLDVSQPAPTPDPGRDFNLVEAITAPDEGGEYDYHQTPAGLIVAQEPEQPRDDAGRFIPSEPTESDNAPAVFSTIVAEDPGAPDEGGEYDYFQTPAGLTVAKLQPGDHLLEEAEAKTFYPHPTPGQTGDALLFESDGARSELVPENPADYLLKEAPPALWTPGGETVHDNDYLLGESDGRRPLADSMPAWLPRGHGSYMGHGERRGAVPRRRRWRSPGRTHRRRGVDAGTLGPARCRPHQTALACGRCAREQLQPRLGGPVGRVHARLRNRPRVNLHDDESLGAPRLRGRLDARDP